MQGVTRFKTRMNEDLTEISVAVPSVDWSSLLLVSNRIYASEIGLKVFPAGALMQITCVHNDDGSLTATAQIIEESIP